MAIDHLIGTEGDDDGETVADPVTFAISVALSAAAAVFVFRWLVPRATAMGRSRAATTGLICGVTSLVPGVAFLWLGFPFVTAGAAVALGLEGWRGERRGQAAVGLAAGAAVIGLGTVLYLYALLD
jgi:hypothetical protein